MRKEPLQNRVDPKGVLHSVASRGTNMGNRGVLHDENQKIVRDFRLKNWIICKTEFNNRQREVMDYNRYTELFFLDEATAFSAGHRPCAECQRKRFNEFKEKWTKANKDRYALSTNSIKEVDEILHKERYHRGKKITTMIEFDELPNGVFIQIDNVCYLVWHKQLYHWTFDGYKKTDLKIVSFLKVKVLTPLSSVHLFKSGFVPVVHHSLFNI